MKKRSLLSLILCIVMVCVSGSALAYEHVQTETVVSVSEMTLSEEAVTPLDDDAVQIKAEEQLTERIGSGDEAGNSYIYEISGTIDAFHETWYFGRWRVLLADGHSSLLTNFLLSQDMTEMYVFEPDPEEENATMFYVSNVFDGNSVRLSLRLNQWNDTVASTWMHDRTEWTWPVYGADLDTPEAAVFVQCQTCGQWYQEGTAHDCQATPESVRCEKCGGLYQAGWNFDHHICAADTEGAVQCEKCGLWFFSQNMLEMHACPADFEE